MTPLLADIVLLLHAGYAAFVIVGLLAVPLGGWLNWRWVRARSLRVVHVLCTTIVAVEALVGMICPLTWLEHVLLVASGAAGYERSFIGQLVYQLLYYDAPAWMFTLAYTVVAVTVALLYHYVPPLPRLSRQRP
jgi:nitrate/nitrite transporter NarK